MLYSRWVGLTALEFVFEELVLNLVRFDENVGISIR